MTASLLRNSSPEGRFWVRINGILAAAKSFATCSPSLDFVSREHPGLFQATHVWGLLSAHDDEFRAWKVPLNHDELLQIVL